MRLLRPVLTIFLAVAAVALPGTAAAAGPGGTDPALPLPVSWSEFRGSFIGELLVDQFAAGSGGELVAVGTLRGATNSRYGREQVDQPARVPVLAINVTCHTLHLELGPLDPRPPSNVGLHLDRFAADITPELPTPAVSQTLNELSLAVQRNAPAGELATMLNLLLSQLDLVIIRTTEVVSSPPVDNPAGVVSSAGVVSFAGR